MIAAWMVYCVAIAVVFVVVGEAFERALHLAGRATRWAWVAALAGSYLVPAAAWLRPGAFGALPIPLARPVVAGRQATAGPIEPLQGGAVPAPPFSLGDLDATLAWAWRLSSAALLLSLGAAALRLAAVRRGWRNATVDGRAVLVSDNVGPAVAGLWRPRVVLPDWALQLGERERRLMLAHEDEHIRARDPWLLAGAAAALLLAPWNPLVWWQVRRLRLAVEMDCDARVLARDGDAPAYGELLLRVGQRRARLPLGAPALGEPVSFLGRRIRRMVTALPRWRWAGAAAGGLIAVAAVIAACEAPRPVGPQAPSDPSAVVEPLAVLWKVPVQDAPTPASLMDEWPAFLSGPPLQYPNLLRQAGIQGRVVVHAIIDTAGRAEPWSVHVIESPHPGFDQAARNFVLEAQFRPGRMRARDVRVSIKFPMNFRTGR